MSPCSKAERQDLVVRLDVWKFVDVGNVDLVPVLHPARMRDLAPHRPELTPADEANSAGVMNPSDV